MVIACWIALDSDIGPGSLAGLLGRERDQRYPPYNSSMAGSPFP